MHVDKHGPRLVLVMTSHILTKYQTYQEHAKGQLECAHMLAWDYLIMISVGGFT